MVRQTDFQKADVSDAPGITHTRGGGALRPRARILRTFGDELISSETVAVTELVKNSYDADATRVLIRFHGPLEIGKGSIEVIDNGHGMGFETIRSTWMEPATLSRKHEPRSRGRARRVLGEKGIGRFATSRLADYLDVVTRDQSADWETHVFFDWSQFDDESKYLDEVEVLWEEESPFEITGGGTVESLWDSGDRPNQDDLTHGTILRMEGLRTDWDSNKFRELRTSLSRLVSPFFQAELANKGDAFEIHLEISEPFDRYSGIIDSPEILRNPHYALQGTVDGEGKYQFGLRLRGKDDQVSVSGVFKPAGRPLECGPLDIELRVWDRDLSSLSELKDDGSFTTVAQVRRELNSAVGISIYRDGFRVLPYGEPNNDWLRLDMRRVQNPTQRLSNNQVLGYLLVSSDANPGLKDQSNREGLIESRSLDDLREFIIFALHQIETRRYTLRHEPSPPQARGTGLFAGFDLSPIRRHLRDRYGDDRELTTLVEKSERDLETRSAGIKEVLSRHHRLAGLGQLIDQVLHDGRAPVAKIKNEALLGLRDIQRSGPGVPQSDERQGNRFKMIETQSDALAVLFKKIEPFGGRRRGRPVAVLLETVISDACSVLDTETSEVGATLSLPESETRVTVDQAEVQQVVINLLQNSLHWLREVPADERQVVVQVNRNGQDEVEVVFSDSGPGVPEEFRDRIFDPYFSTKPDGVGLGLMLAGEIVTEYYGGVLELLESGPLTGATFRFTLCRRV